MHVISLYLILHACTATFDVMCVKKTETTKWGLKPYSKYLNPKYPIITSDNDSKYLKLV
jgi:hypothetical protein